MACSNALEFEVSPMWLVLPTKLWHKHQDLQDRRLIFLASQFECIEFIQL